jgi:hypothetical protein
VEVQFLHPHLLDIKLVRRRNRIETEIIAPRTHEVRRRHSPSQFMPLIIGGDRKPRRRANITLNRLIFEIKASILVGRDATHHSAKPANAAGFVGLIIVNISTRKMLSLYA